MPSEPTPRPEQLSAGEFIVKVTEFIRENAPPEWISFQISVDAEEEIKVSFGLVDKDSTKHNPSVHANLKREWIR